MEYTEKELLMYQIMKSIYDYSTLINFKGSMVIKACLCEMGYLEQTRHTVDIDGKRNILKTYQHKTPSCL